MRTCAAYDSTVKAMGFDEVRVRYRQSRREIVRRVIENALIGEAMQKFIIREAKRVVLENERKKFVDESRLARLGITVEQLQYWKGLTKE